MMQDSTQLISGIKRAMRDQKDHFLVAKLSKSSASKKKKVQTNAGYESDERFVVTGAYHFITFYKFEGVFPIRMCQTTLAIQQSPICKVSKHTLFCHHSTWLSTL